MIFSSGFVHVGMKVECFEAAKETPVYATPVVHFGSCHLRLTSSSVAPMEMP